MEKQPWASDTDKTILRKQRERSAEGRRARGGSSAEDTGEGAGGGGADEGGWLAEHAERGGASSIEVAAISQVVEHAPFRVEARDCRLDWAGFVCEG